MPQFYKLFSPFLSPFYLKLLFYFKVLGSNKTLIFRILIIWIISLFILSNDGNRKNYDYRYSLRGPQSFSKDIVLLTISQTEWDELFRPSLLKSMIYRGEPVSDSYYWNKFFWLKVFQNLESLKPKKVGVDFYFPKAISTTWEIRRFLSSQNAIWLSEADSIGRILPSKFSDNFNENIGINLMKQDYDGAVRSFYFSLFNIPQMPESLVIESTQDLKGESIINFRGPKNTFKNIPLLQVFDGTIQPEEIENKIVLIGPEYGAEHIIKTPLGEMNRIEIYANIIDNILNKRWIKKVSFLLNSIYLLVLIIITTLIIFNFPQGIGITLLFSLCFLSASFSIFLFDIFYLWTPLITGLATIFLTYVIVISQMLFDREKNMWKMQKEQDYHKSLEELKTNFVSLISHDLKTPLAKIQSVIHRVKNDPNLSFSKEIGDDLNSIYNESKHLDRYIKSILQLLKIESKDFRIIKKPIDINTVIEEVCRQLQPLASEKKLKFELHLEPLFSIEADKLLMTEILLNIIENAIKYTYEKTTIHISSLEKEGFISIVVKDEGPGIKKEHLRLIYDKFFRAEKVGNLAAAGTGLGLFLVKYFIELHNGDINVTSDLNQGTNVIIRIPTGD